MKRILLFAALLVSTASFAQHPTDKGWRSVGGTGDLFFDLDNEDGTDNYFSLVPEVYWFVGNSFALGTDMGLGMSTSKSKVKDTSTYRSQDISAWIAPGFRFYFRDPEKPWRPYMFLNVGYTTSAMHEKYDNKIVPSLNYDNKSTTNGFRGYTGAGIAWFFSDHAAFDIRCRILDIYPERVSPETVEMQFGYSPNFMIGVQAFFD